jgi:DNA-binding Xre family transcriptional regulator
VGGKMISYKPLFETLKKKEMVISDLRGDILHPKTIASINKGDYINLQTIDKICQELKVPITKVVEVIIE